MNLKFLAVGLRRPMSFPAGDRHRVFQKKLSPSADNGAMGNRTIIALSTVLICLLSFFKGTTVFPGEGVKDPIVGETSSLLDKAVRKGEVRIIVGLKLPEPGFRPEGMLTPNEVRQQRQTIENVRKSLTDSLAGHNVDVYSVYTSLPYVAMKVDAAALKKIAVSRYVAGIQEDTASGTHQDDPSNEARKISGPPGTSAEPR